MQIVCFFIVFYVVMKMLSDYEPTQKRINRMDNDPNCSFKSDKWLKQHPEWEGRY